MPAAGTFPQALPNDPEDVSWALSTGQAMWSRGDVLEAIRWIKRASESAADAGADDRAFALARAAADLKMASGTTSITPAPPEVATPFPVIPAPPPPLSSPQRPAAFAPPPSRPATVRPPPAANRTPLPGPAGSPLGGSLGNLGITEKRQPKIGATTMQSAGVPSPSPRPKPVTPSVFPLPGAAGNAPGGANHGPPLSQRSGTMVMAATPSPPMLSGTPVPSSAYAPETVLDSYAAHTAVGESTAISDSPPGLAARLAEGPSGLIEDFPTMARVQPFELTGAADVAAAARPQSNRPPAMGVARADVPPARGPLPTPSTAVVPAMRVWIHRLNGITRVTPLSSPRPEGAVQVVLVSPDESVNLAEWLSS